MTPATSFSVSLLAGIVFVLGSAEPSAAQCNHCGYTASCPAFQHWDNCGTDGPGFSFSGPCAAGCHYLDCTGAHAPSGGCTPEDQDDLIQAVQDAQEDSDWQEFAKLTLTGVLQFDAARNVVFVPSCNGVDVVAQIPLPRELGHRWAASVDSERLRLLADMVGPTS